MIDLGSELHKVTDFVVAKSIGRSPSAPQQLVRPQKSENLSDVYRKMNLDYFKQRDRARNKMQSFSTGQMQVNLHSRKKSQENRGEKETKESLITALNKISFNLTTKDQKLLKAKKSQMPVVKKSVRKPSYNPTSQQFIMGSNGPQFQERRDPSQQNDNGRASSFKRLPKVRQGLTMKSLFDQEKQESSARIHRGNNRKPSTDKLEKDGTLSFKLKTKETPVQLSELDRPPSAFQQDEQTLEASERCNQTIDKYFQQRIFGGDNLAMARLKRFQILKLNQAETLKRITAERSAAKLQQLPGYLIERKFSRTKNLINEELEKFKVQKLVSNQVFTDLKNFTIQA